MAVAVAAVLHVHDRQLSGALLSQLDLARLPGFTARATAVETTHALQRKWAHIGPTTSAADVPERRNPRASGGSGRVSDGTRTRDRLDHNQELYQLSYAHHAPPVWATFAI